MFQFFTSTMGRAFRSILRSRGYELRQVGSPPRGFERFLAFAKSRGLAPRTVFDVGVGRGTPWLYAAFPDSYFVLVEALPRLRMSVQQIAKDLGGESHAVALGRTPGSRTIRVPRESETGASLLERSDQLAELRKIRGQSNDDSFEDVEVTTLDSLAVHEGPYFLKIDVEGSEYDVLLGGSQTLENTVMVLLELSVFPRHRGEASFADVVSLLDERGFELFDIVELHQEGLSGPLVFIDAAFTRKDAPLWRSQE